MQSWCIHFYYAKKLIIRKRKQNIYLLITYFFSFLTWTFSCMLLMLIYIKNKTSFAENVFASQSFWSPSRLCRAGQAITYSQVRDACFPDSAGDGFHRRAHRVQQRCQLTRAFGFSALFKHKSRQSHSVSVERPPVWHDCRFQDSCWC